MTVAKNILEALATKTENLISNVNEGVSIMDRYMEPEEKKSTNNLLKSYRRKLKKIRHAITQKPVVALFGASQAGKSYLVKNLLSIRKSPLIIDSPVNGENKDQKYDFIERINPVGQGAESTSVVTRFTIDACSKFQDYPVKVKLLTAKDLIIIFCDSYYSDFKIRNYKPTVANIEEDLQKVMQLQTQSEQFVLLEDDVLDIRDYIEENFKNLSAGFKQQMQLLDYLIFDKYIHLVLKIQVFYVVDYLDYLEPF